MSEYSAHDSDQDGETPPLPENLAALVGSIQGLADLGRNHDKYLAYPDREHDGGAASA
jgi:hypothetical protein